MPDSANLGPFNHPNAPSLPRVSKLRSENDLRTYSVVDSHPNLAVGIIVEGLVQKPDRIASGPLAP